MDKNECRHLPIDQQAYAKALKTDDPLASLFRHQEALHVMASISIPDPRWRLSAVLAYLNTQYHGLQDELREVFDALGGVDSHGSAVWKDWKNRHAEASGKTLRDLTDEELLELRFELVDCLKFLLNMMLAVGMTPADLYNLFLAKTQENLDRQKRGY